MPIEVEDEAVLEAIERLAAIMNCSPEEAVDAAVNERLAALDENCDQDGGIQR
jgi:hypothetical protein